MNGSKNKENHGRETPRTQNASAPQHLLLTALGKYPKGVSYSFGEQRINASLAPIALFELLPEAERPDCIVALCTEEATLGSLSLLEETLGDRCEVRQVNVTDGDNQEDINCYLDKVVKAIPNDVDLTVDITHGYRHFPFLTYTAVLYLAALDGIRLRGAYYGMLKQDETSTFLDLCPLLQLPRWVYALEVLNDTGSTFPLSQILKNETENNSTQSNTPYLKQFSEAYLSGLPLELGWQAHNIQLDNSRESLSQTLQNSHHPPLTHELIERLMKIVKPFALIEEPILGNKKWKRHINLSESELIRQSRVIKSLLDHGHFAAAFGLMREWTVSWAVWLHGQKEKWLDNKVRSKATNTLGAIGAVARDGELSDYITEEQRKFGKFWITLCDIRNSYHHHGMSTQVLIEDDKTQKKFLRIKDYWEKTLSLCPDFCLSLRDSSGGKTLVTPIGEHPGVLFSALQACREDGNGESPALCLVICSSETKGMIAEVLEHAEFKGRYEPLMLEDPFGGQEESESLVRKERKHFIGSDMVLVNVTGGTTLMGLTAESFATEAHKLSCSVRRFGLIKSKKSDTNPYQMGKTFWIDPEESEDAGGN